MKPQRMRFRLLAFILIGLFALLAAYGLYSINTYGNRWFAYNRNPRIREQKRSVLAGDILDRNSVLLASTDADGTRVYQADETARRAVVHLLGDPQGHVANGVETFQTGYLYGFHATLPELLSVRLGQNDGVRVGDDVTHLRVHGRQPLPYPQQRRHHRRCTLVHRGQCGQLRNRKRRYPRYLPRLAQLLRLGRRGSGVHL